MCDDNKKCSVFDAQFYVFSDFTHSKLYIIKKLF